MANSDRRKRAASTSAEPLTTPRRPDGQSRCRTHRRHLIEARRAPGASRSSLLASSPPVAKAKGTDAKRQQRRSLSGRLHPGIPGEIISERRATSNRNGARDHPGIPGDFSRNQQFTVPRSGPIKNNAVRYRASKHDCDACPFKPRCCPNTPARNVPRSIYEGARDLARDIAKTKAYQASRCQRKKSRCCSPTSNAF